MENENDKNYLDERKGLDENDSPNLDPENEIESGPKKELLDSSNDAEGLKNENNEVNNEVLDMMKKKKSKDLTIPIILGIVFLAIIVIVGFYLLKNKDIPLVERESPQQKILNSSMLAMNDVESYSFEGDLNLDFINSGHTTTKGQTGEEGFSLAMKFDGQADGSDTDNIKSSFNVSPEISVSTEGGSEDVSFDFSMRSFGKVGEEMAYFKLNDFDLGAAGLMYGEMIVPYKNKWYSLDMKELQEKSNNSFEGGDFDIKKMIEEVKDLSEKYEMIKFQKDLGDTKLGDVDVYHYQVTIDSEAAFDFYVELLKTSPFLISGATDGELENFEAELEENREEILIVINEILTNVEIEVWIGKDDKIIHKIDLRGDYDEKDMERLTEMILGKARTKAVDAAIKSEVSSKQPELIIYCDDNNGDCRGFKSKYWGSTVPPKYQIEQHIETGENYSYVIWSELCSTTDKWCVDSEGNQGYFLGEIKGIQCPDNMSPTPQGEKKNCTIGVSDDNPLEKMEVSLNMSITMSNFNQPISISKPEESENLMKVLEEMMMGFMGGMMTPGASLGNNDSDQDGLSDEIETYYGTDPNNPDTDGDGFSDGNEVSRGYDPLLPGEAKLDYDKMFKY